MRKFWLLTALLLLCSAWLVAQSTSPAASPNSPAVSSSQTSDTEGKTIEGCLSGSAGNWTLTDSSGKTWQLQGDDSKLSKEVGHQVKIKGSEMPASPSSPGATPPSAGASAAQFNVKSVTKIADTCSK